MRGAKWTAALVALVGALGAACSKGGATDSGGASEAPASDAGASDANVDGPASDAERPEADGAADAPLAPCLDRPTELPRPPTGRLPCDLLPPGFVP